MAWIESHQTLREHPKTKMLARRLGISRVAAIGHLHCLWWWALDYAQDGDLSKYDDEMIAEAADWADDASTFVSALRAVGFLDPDPARIHDWHDFAGKLVERRRVNAERMRETRAAHVQDTCSARAASPDAARVGLPYRTVPYQTEPTAATIVAAPDDDPPDDALGPPKRPDQAIFDVLVRRFGKPTNATERGKFNKAVQLLRQSECDDAEVDALIAAAEDRWGAVAITPMGVAGNVVSLRRPARAGPPSKANGHVDQSAANVLAARQSRLERS